MEHGPTTGWASPEIENFDKVDVCYLPSCRFVSGVAMSFFEVHIYTCIFRASAGAVRESRKRRRGEMRGLYIAKKERCCGCESMEVKAWEM